MEQITGAALDDFLNIDSLDDALSFRRTWEQSPVFCNQGIFGDSLDDLPDRYGHSAQLHRFGTWEDYYNSGIISAARVLRIAALTRVRSGAHDLNKTVGVRKSVDALIDSITQDEYLTIEAADRDGACEITLRFPYNAYASATSYLGDLDEESGNISGCETGHHKSETGFWDYGYIRFTISNRLEIIADGEAQSLNDSLLSPLLRLHLSDIRTAVDDRPPFDLIEVPPSPLCALWEGFRISQQIGRIFTCKACGRVHIEEKHAGRPRQFCDGYACKRWYQRNPGKDGQKRR